MKWSWKQLKSKRDTFRAILVEEWQEREFCKLIDTLVMVILSGIAIFYETIKFAGYVVDKSILFFLGDCFAVMTT